MSCKNKKEIEKARAGLIERMNDWVPPKVIWKPGNETATESAEKCPNRGSDQVDR